MTAKKITIISVIVILIFWIGIPKIIIWKADKKVDKLCSTQTLFNVYEQIYMANEEYNKFRIITLSGPQYDDPNLSYYAWTSTTVIEGDVNSAEATSLVISKTSYKVYSSSPHRLLGESVTFSRSGGDPWLSFMPSRHSCNIDQINGLLSKVFIKVK
ncbi:hypothetical protein ACWWD9_02710 [Methylovorus sp. SPW-M1]